ARRVIVGVGGSATTDGGQGCIDALEPRGRLAGVELVVAYDVSTPFVDAAAVFAGQKGATPKQVALLTRRLERLAQLYEEIYGVDVRGLPGSGAAGGLAGGLAAVGAELVPGFELVAEVLELPARIDEADLVATGEGFLDEHSFSEKAVGGVLELASAAGVPALVVAGDILNDLAVPTRDDVAVVSLAECFGRERASTDTSACIEEVTRRHLAKLAR
ncbi:MAG: glycerate kinase, partial [Actinomycetota bacterium]|nr:glycerate kinase [Actinomycetota bacterium]